MCCHARKIETRTKSLVGCCADGIYNEQSGPNKDLTTVLLPYFYSVLVLVGVVLSLSTFPIFLSTGAGLLAAMRPVFLLFALLALIFAVDAREDRVARLKRQLLARQSPFKGPTTVTTTRTAET